MILLVHTCSNININFCHIKKFDLIYAVLSIIFIAKIEHAGHIIDIWSHEHDEVMNINSYWP